MALAVALASAVPLGAAPAFAGGPTIEDLLGAFVEDLHALRAGDDGAAAALEELARRLCEEHGRCDALDIARYYADLSPGARQEGLEHEARFVELYGRVHDADGRTGEEWEVERDAIRTDLDALIADCRSARDVVPAGRALSLSALLHASHQRKAGLEPGERRRIAERAEADARASIEQFERAGMVKPALEPRHTLAELLAERGRLAQARELFAQLEQDARGIDYDPFRESALVGLIGLARRCGDLREEERHIRTLATFRDPAECWVLAHQHGWYLLMTDNAPEAMGFLERNRPRGGANGTDLVEWNFLMSMAATWSGDPELAQTYLDEAYYDVPGFEPHVLAQARIDLARGEHHAVIELLSDRYLLDALQPRELVHAQAFLGEALMRAGMLASAAEELEVALELCEEWTGYVEEERSGGGPLGVVGEWMGLHTVALLAEAYAGLGRDLDAARLIEDCQSRSLRADPDLARLRRHLGRPVGGPRLTHDDLLAWAAASELGLVTWVVGAERTVVVHVAADGRASARVAPLGRGHVAEGARRLRERARFARGPGGPERLAGAGDDLARNLLPDSLLESLGRAGDRAAERRLLALVHGPVEALPLSLLEVGGRPLDELCTLRVLPGVPAARPGPAVRLDLRDWSLLGAPVADDPALDLPAARAELEALVRRYGGAHAATGASFVGEEVERLLTAGRPLHLATHLLAAQDCTSLRYSDVGVLLSHGEVLCLERLAELAPASPLAVLSACGTGRGVDFDAEGQQSLARVLLESGTRNVLVTLWPVADEAARAFAGPFHDALQAGASPSTAAREARAAMRRDGASPDTWAVFRLVGRD